MGHPNLFYQHWGYCAPHRAGLRLLCPEPRQLARIHSKRRKTPPRSSASPPSIEEAHLRVLEDVPIDCLLIEHGAQDVLKITDLLTIRSVLTAVSKPSVVCVRAKLSEGDLSALQHVGAIGIVVDVASEEDAAELPRLRKEIDALPPREEDERRQVESIGSHLSHSPAHSAHDDDDDLDD